MSGKAIKLMSGVTTASPTYSDPRYFAPPMPYPYHDCQITLTGSGAVSATVVVEASLLEMEGWAPVFTVNLSGTNSDAWLGQMYAGNGRFYRFKVTAISGTSATLNGYITD